MRLLVLVIKPDSGESEYPLEHLSTAERADVYVNAAALLAQAPERLPEGHMRCDADARSFFAFLRRQSVPAADYPFGCFSGSELEQLAERSWLPIGPSGDRLKARLLQLVHATCVLRMSVAHILGRGDLHVERYVWKPGAYATDDDINDALRAFGLSPRELVSATATPSAPAPPEACCSSAAAGSLPSALPQLSMLSDALRLAGVEFPPRTPGSSLSPVVEFALRRDSEPLSPSKLRLAQESQACLC